MCGGDKPKIQQVQAPTQSDAEVQEALEKERELARRRRGRRSTILTSPQGVQDSGGWKTLLGQ